MKDTQREAEAQAEGEAGFPWGAQCGIRSQDPGLCPELKADVQPLGHPSVPLSLFLSITFHPSTSTCSFISVSCLFLLQYSFVCGDFQPLKEVEEQTVGWASVVLVLGEEKWISDFWHLPGLLSPSSV